MSNPSPFKWRHFEAEIILLCVRWYLRYSLSYRDLEEMMAERGLTIDHTTIYRWVQRYAPELEKRCRPHVKAFTDSWKVDETYIKVRRKLDVSLPGHRLARQHPGVSLECDARCRGRQTLFRQSAALLCLFSSSGASGRGAGGQPTAPADPNTTKSAPRVINVDKNAAYPKAMADLKASGVLPEMVELRQVKYLNNLIEQDHRFIKRLVKPGMGFFSFETAGRTLQGYEVMNMIREGTRGGQRRHQWSGHLHRPPVWSGGLSPNRKVSLTSIASLPEFLQHNLLSHFHHSLCPQRT